MKPTIELLSDDLVKRILDEAFQLLMDPGIKVQSAEARELLADHGAHVDQGDQVVSIPEALALQALTTVPRQFNLYDR
ncbi:MAG: trimethylamine methyltransferase family protein, partial [Anaerolineales bacterium]|nr:trimethylamine methyltransferase family protein [Anaerolineales bacterium]